MLENISKEEFAKGFIEYIKEYEQHLKETITDDYLNWIYNWNYKSNGMIYDDDCQYRNDISQEDIEKCLSISALHSFIQMDNSYREEYEFKDENSYFYNDCSLIYLKDKWYLIKTMFGQGSLTTLEPIDIEKYQNKTTHYYDLNSKEWKIFN